MFTRFSPGVVYPGGIDLTARNITLIGNFTQEAGASFTALIRGKPGATGSTEKLTYDYLRINGSASIDGNLVLTVDQRYSQSLQLLTFRYTSYYSGVSITIISFFSVTGDWASRSTVRICVASCTTTTTSTSTTSHLKTSGRTVTKVESTSTGGSTTGGVAPTYDCGSYGSGSYAVLISGSTCPCSPGWSGTNCDIGISLPNHF